MKLTRKGFAPPRAVWGNIEIQHGQAWAHYILDVPSRVYGDERKRLWVAREHTKLLAALKRQGVVVQALASPVRAATAKARGLLRVDARQHPKWLELVDELGNIVEDLQPWEHVFWLYVPLGSNRNKFGFAISDLTASIRDEEQKFFDEIPPAYRANRATSEQVEWFANHKAGLGVLQEEIPPPFLRGDGGHEAYPDLDLDEGAQSDHDGPWASFTPVVKITDLNHPERPPSYQTVMVVERFPEGGIYFHSSQFTNILDDLDTEAVVEWAMRLEWDSKQKALLGNQKERRKAFSQEEQREVDPALQDESLGEVVGELADADRELSVGDEALVKYTIFITIGAGDAATCSAAVHEIRDRFANLSFTLQTPVAKQCALWASTLPSKVDMAPAEVFRHRASRSGWGMFTPLLTTHVGESWGIPHAVSKASRRLSLVYSNPGDWHGRNRPAVMLWIGKSGGGKTRGMMFMSYCCALRGDAPFVFDETPDRQHEKLVPFVRDARVFDFRSYLIDPMVCLPETKAGYDAAYSLIIGMLGVGVRSREAGLLSQTLSPKGRELTGVRSLRGLLDWLRAPAVAAKLEQARTLFGLPDDAAAADALAKLDDVRDVFSGWAARDYAACLFDDTLPPLNLMEGSMWVFRMSALDLPERPDLEGGVELAPTAEEEAGIAVFNLTAFYVQAAAWSRPEFNPIVGEETWRWKLHPLLSRFASRVAREGRTGRVGFFGASQHGDMDFPAEIVRAQPTLVLTAHGDREGATSTLTKFGYKGDFFDDWADALVYDTNPEPDDAPGARLWAPRADETEQPTGREGEALMRDAKGTWGWVQQFDFFDPAIRAAVNTNPRGRAADR